jgi:ribosome-binding protein aMBF1 (putative translation factor)
VVVYQPGPLAGRQPTREGGAVPRGRAWEATHLAGSDRADPAKFRQAIEAAGLSYRQLAEQLKVPRSTLYNIGQGKAVVSQRFARDVEEALKVEAGSIFTGGNQAAS